MSDLDNVPYGLQQFPQWMPWKAEPIPGKPRYSKVPVNPKSGVKADHTDPKNWVTFDQAVELVQLRFQGIGFEFTENDPFVCIDLDDCRDPETGEIKPWALRVIQTIGSYTEVSPSGTGLHIIVRGSKPGNRCRRDHLEMYEAKRFLTVTGQHLETTPLTIEDRQAEVNEVYLTCLGSQPDGQQINLGFPAKGVDLDDRALVERAKSAANGAKFAKLWSGDWTGYSSQSDADLALANMVGFWTGGDEARIDRLFRKSGLYREKWELEDYRIRTINKAVQSRFRRFPAEVLRLLQWMKYQDWHGMDGATDWQLLLAHIFVASHAGKGEYDASERRLAKLIIADRGTVRAANLRLQSRGVLTPVDLYRSPEHGGSWRLLVPIEPSPSTPEVSPVPQPSSFYSSPDSTFSLPMDAHHTTSSSYTPTPNPIAAITTIAADSNSSRGCLCEELYGCNLVVFHDVWVWREALAGISSEGLGKTALRLWVTLLDESEWDVKDLAVRLDVGADQVRRKLKELGQHGLGQKIGKGRWRGIPADSEYLDQIAQDLGVAGARARKSAEHDRDREGFKKYLRDTKYRPCFGNRINGGARQTPKSTGA